MKGQILIGAAFIAVAVGVSACGGGSAATGVPSKVCSRTLHSFATARYAAQTGNAIMLWNEAAAAYETLTAQGYSGSHLAHDLSQMKKSAVSGNAAGAVRDLRGVYADCGKKY